jgi:hypothetical protein
MLGMGGSDGQGGEYRQCEQAQDGSSSPRCPGADLMLVEPDQGFGGLEVLLDRPSAPGDVHQVVNSTSLGTLAAAHRSGSPVQGFGRYNSASTRV